MKEILIEFLFGNPEMQKAIAPLAIAAAAAAAPGMIKAVGSMFGGGKRRREQKAAKQELAQRKQAYESMTYTNPYANMQNAYEDVTINQQAAQFQAQQQQQGLANVMGGLQQASGGSGIAALAQTLAQQQSTNLQASAADIASQEQQLKMATAGESSRLQGLEAEGKIRQEEFEFGKATTLLDAAAQRKMHADAARAQAKQELIGGISEAAAGAADAIMPSLTGGGGGSSDFSKYKNAKIPKL